MTFPSTPQDRETTSLPEPCQCMTSWAYITNRHDGHCCFFPATQTCHPEEVAEWERGRDRRRGSR